MFHKGVAGRGGILPFFVLEALEWHPHCYSSEKIFWDGLLKQLALYNAKSGNPFFMSFSLALQFIGKHSDFQQLCHTTQQMYCRPCENGQRHAWAPWLGTCWSHIIRQAQLELPTLHHHVWCGPSKHWLSTRSRWTRYRLACIAHSCALWLSVGAAIFHRRLFVTAKKV